MLHTTLIYLIRDRELCLAFKKSGFGAGKYNGVGGKLDPGETPEECAVRELREETRVVAHPEDLEYVALHYFHNPTLESVKMHTYLVRRFDGEPCEVEKVIPQWFSFDELPWDTMWASDAHWLSSVLAGERVHGEFWFDASGETVVRHRVSPLV